MEESHRLSHSRGAKRKVRAQRYFKQSDGKYHCDKCAKRFVTRGGLHHHLPNHNPESLWITCEYCGGTYRTPHIYKAHKKKNKSCRMKQIKALQQQKFQT